MNTPDSSPKTEYLPFDPASKDKAPVTPDEMSFMPPQELPKIDKDYQPLPFSESPLPKPSWDKQPYAPLESQVVADKPLVAEKVVSGKPAESEVGGVFVPVDVISSPVDVELGAEIQQFLAEGMKSIKNVQEVPDLMMKVFKLTQDQVQKISDFIQKLIPFTGSMTPSMGFYGEGKKSYLELMSSSSTNIKDSKMAIGLSFRVWKDDKKVETRLIVAGQFHFDNQGKIIKMFDSDRREVQS